MRTENGEIEKKDGGRDEDKKLDGGMAGGEEVRLAGRQGRGLNLGSGKHVFRTGLVFFLLRLSGPSSGQTSGAYVRNSVASVANICKGC